MFGRFGVAFLGFAFNLENKPFHDAPILRPDWAKGTLNRDDVIQQKLNNLIGNPKDATGE